VETPRRAGVPSIRRLDVAGAAAAADARVELSAAIELVAAGRARRVLLSGLPDVEAAAAEALARAQREDVAFGLRRDAASGSITVVIGPRAP
jgi:hypothetical protein